MLIYYKGTIVNREDYNNYLSWNDINEYKY